jgi:hypothetical protein
MMEYINILLQKEFRSILYLKKLKNEHLKMFLTYRKIISEMICSEELQNQMLFKYRKAKLRPVETIPGMGWGWIKDNDGGDEFNYDIV